MKKETKDKFCNKLLLWTRYLKKKSFPASNSEVSFFMFIVWLLSKYAGRIKATLTSPQELNWRKFTSNSIYWFFLFQHTDIYLGWKKDRISCHFMLKKDISQLMNELGHIHKNIRFNEVNMFFSCHNRTIFCVCPKILINCTIFAKFVSNFSGQSHNCTN